MGGIPRKARWTASDMKIFSLNETEVWLLEVEKAAALRRKTVHQILAQITGCAEDSIALDTTRYGKHILPGAPFDWSVSYTSQHLAFGWSQRGHIGIDIEDTTQVRAFADIASEFFTPRERAQCRSASDFYTTWTAKESLMKAVGLGFNLEPHKFSLAIDDREIRVETIDGYRKEDFHFETTLTDAIQVCVCQFIPE